MTITRKETAKARTCLTNNFDAFAAGLRRIPELSKDTGKDEIVAMFIRYMDEK